MVKSSNLIFVQKYRKLLSFIYFSFNDYTYNMINKYGREGEKYLLIGVHNNPEMCYPVNRRQRCTLETHTHKYSQNFTIYY